MITSHAVSDFVTDPASDAVHQYPHPSIDQGAVGVFDSGLGGLTVLSALRARLPHEKFLYFADTRYLPYGDRSEDFLRERGVQVVKRLVAAGVKAVVIACNTATAAAAEAIRAQCPSLPVIALEPGVKPAVALSGNGVIGVMATTRTLQSARFDRLVKGHASHLQIVPQACPDLADAIESEGPQSQRVNQLLDQYVEPLADAGVDVVVLGCTHYPWVRDGVAARLPSGVKVIDTGEAVARQLERVLEEKSLLQPVGSNTPSQTVWKIATSGDLAQIQSALRHLGEHCSSIEVWE